MSLVEGCVVGVEVLGKLQGCLTNLPFAEAVLLPVGEVLFGDGPAGKLTRKEGFHFRQGVEPFEKAAGRFVVLQTTVESFAEITG